ncbi:Cys-tRNA(Pro) deacylase [Shewanella donghaensis]|uniref:Cys-tRNA(Pro) deacylase n=1 Tax=Shewanella donghaensis TaxID=238836 RepID=UPI001183557A|nr:Cys-tRNA(Pro) deacylase [Shewanella donghaensis]
MTPAINMLNKHKIPYEIVEYTHDSSVESYGGEAVEKLGVPAEQVFKTLVVAIDNKELVVAVVPMTAMLNLKLIAKAMGAKKAIMADISAVEKSTGYILGGVSPLGQKKRLKTVIDSSAKHFKQVFVSGGRRGLEISLCPLYLQQFTQGVFANIGCE